MNKKLLFALFALFGGFVQVNDKGATMDLHENLPDQAFSSVDLLRPTTRNTHLEAATRYVEEHFFGDKALFARRAFEDINARFFHGQLPWALIVWGLTAHGKCLGFTHADLNKAPVITLHPSLLGGTEKLNPWGISSQHLGHCYAYDLLLHECMHVSVEYLLGGQHGGDSSHNCPAWVSEVNRLASLLGFPDVRAEMTKVVRVKDASGSTVQRVNKGNISLRVIASFPYGLRSHFKDWSFYEHRVLPWDTECYAQLDVTEKGNKEERT